MEIISIVFLTLGLLTLFVGCVLFVLVPRILKTRTKALKKQSELSINTKKVRIKLEQENQKQIWESKKQEWNIHLEELKNEISLKEKMVQKKIEHNDSRAGEIEQLKKDYIASKKILAKEQEKIVKSLEKVSGLSKEEALKKLLDNVNKQQDQKLKKVVKDKIDETKKTLKKQVCNLLAGALERSASDFVTERTVSKITIENEAMKGRIIGKDGRNIDAFKEFSGTDVILEKDSSVIKISSFNPIRREIAIRALKRLIEDGRIQPQRIQDFIKEEEAKVDEIIHQTGQKTVNELKITNIHPELIFCLGKLKYRTSYDQNILQHSIEVAKFAGNLAKELDLDDELAIRAGLLHDIGKSLDYEIEKSHVTLGVELATKYQENEIVINAIHSHHEDVPKNNIYSFLVSTADTLSAARLGARSNTQTDYLKRMKTIEEVVTSFPGVTRNFAVGSGRVIKVWVDASIVDDSQTETIADEIKTKLKTELKIPGDIQVEVFRKYKVTKNF